MPTRPPVLLQRRKSAAAGVANALAKSAQAASSTGQRTAPDPMNCTLIPPTRIIRLAISRRFHLTVNEDGPKVIDVREGGARAQEVAQTLEKTSGIVVGKKGGRIEAKFLCPRGGFAVHIGSGGILRRTFATIGTISIAGQRRDTACAGKFDREGKRIFLVRSAAPLPADRHRELTA